jgi:glycerophosphoryl diester phosphodiesterase
MVDPWVYARYIDAQAIHPHYRVALECPGLLEGCRRNGVSVNAWTVNDPADIKELAQQDVNAIITNFPDIALKSVKG